MKARTMVYLERQQLKTLKAKARDQQVSLAELVRRVVKAYLDEPRALPAVPTKAYAAMVAIGSSGRQDIAERHDTYLADALRREHAR